MHSIATPWEYHILLELIRCWYELNCESVNMPVSGQCTIIVRREPVTSWMGTSEGRGHQSKGHVVRRRWWLPVHNLSKVTCPLINYKGFNEARAIKLDIKTYQIRFMFYPLLLPCSLSDKSFLNIKNYHQKYSVTVVDV